MFLLTNTKLYATIYSEVMIMPFIRKLMDDRFAKRAAQFMRYACYFLILIFIFCTLLSITGRQTFILYSKTGTYERATIQNHENAPHSSAVTVSVNDDIRVWTNENDEIDLSIQIGLSLMYAVSTLPIILAVWLLSHVFHNIQKGDIFSEQNASYLLFYGLIQVSVAIFVPLLKLLICWLVNLVSSGRMSIATGQDAFNMIPPGIAFLVAAYIIHYGVSLQDEVDHTL